MPGHRCEGRIEQAHERNQTGLGLKAPERRSIPLCSKLHREYDQHRGPFAGWTREERQEWIANHIAAEQDIYSRQGGIPW